MTIKMKMMELLNMKDAFVVLTQADLPVKAALQVRRIAKAADEHLNVFQSFLSDTRKRLGKEENGMVTVLDENKEEFEKLVNEAADAEIELNVNPLSIDALGERATVKPAVLLALDKILQD